MAIPATLQFSVTASLPCSVALAPSLGISKSATRSATATMGIEVWKIGPVKLRSWFDGLASGARFMGIVAEAFVVMTGVGTIVTKQFQILGAIVKVVSVNMVNDLFIKQWPSKQSLHDNAMLKDSFAANAKNAIPVAVNRAGSPSRLNSLGLRGVVAFTPAVYLLSACLSEGIATSNARFHATIVPISVK